MKKAVTFIFVLCCTTWVMNAQMLATFEDGANDLMAIDPTFWYMPEVFVDGGAPQIGSNTDKSGLNKSDKCFLAVNVANADWWGNFISLKLVNPITVTESNRYLRFMAYRSIQPKNFRIGINGREDANSVYQNKLKNDGAWEGVVADLGTKFMGQEIKDIEIVFSNNWDDPRTGWGVGTYMFDNFELSNTPIPPGINVMDGNGLSIGFENQAETDKWVNTIDMINAANNYKIIDNPFTSSVVDNGGKIFQFDKSDQASWWQGARFDFTGIMPVGNGNPNQLHVMVYIPAKVLGDLPSIDIQLCAKDHMGNENTQIFTVWDDQVDEWMDLVMQIDKITYLKEVTVRFDVRRNADDTGWINSPANTFYLDAIAFDNDPNPRAKIITGLPEVLLNNTLANIRTLSKAIQVDVNQKAGVQVYNVLGGLVKSISLDGSATINLETGIYIVKIASATGQKQISKVLVK
jgi:hypothetical protein